MQKAIILTEAEYAELSANQAESYDYQATSDVIEKLTKENKNLHQVISDNEYKINTQYDQILNLTANIEELKKVAGGLKLTEEELQELAIIFNNAIKYMRMKSRDYHEEDIQKVQSFFMKIQRAK